MARVMIVAALVFLFPVEGAELAAGPFETGVAERDGFIRPSFGEASRPLAGQGARRAAGAAAGKVPPRSAPPTPESGSGAPDQVDIDAAARLDYSSSRGGAE